MELYAISISRLKNTRRFSVLHRLDQDLHNAKKNQLLAIGDSLGIDEWTKWYKVRAKDVVKLGGGRLLRDNGNSLSKTLSVLLPEYSWDPWKFFKTPKGVWDQRSTLSNFISYLEETLNIKEWKDWYRIDRQTVIKYGGASFLDHFGGSLVNAIMEYYPDRPWIPSEFIDNHDPESSYWKDKSRQRACFDELGKQLGIKHWEDWYQISMKDVLKLHMVSFLSSFYSSSLVKALLSIYPEHNWQVWKFNKVNNDFWSNIHNQRDFLDWIAEKFHVHKPEDWYDVRIQDIIRNGGGSLLKIHDHSFFKMISTIYREIQFDEANFNAHSNPRSPYAKSQRLLLKCIRQIIPPNMDVHFDYFHPKLRFIHYGKKEDVEDLSELESSELIIPTGRRMELDIFVPSLQIAFEYQGRHHYEEVRYLKAAHKEDEKRKACEDEGITLIEIPYWWDGSVDSLKATIHSIRPDIVKETDLSLGSKSIEPYELRLKRNTYL